MYPTGSVGLRDGSAVHDCDQKVANRIHGRESEEQCSSAVFDSPDDEDGAHQKQRSLETERRVHEVSQRRFERATLSDAARRDSEVTDEIVGVAVVGPKTHGRNGFEDEVAE